MSIAYFDCFSGISGDMTVGALLDAGADFEALQAALNSLGVPGFTVSRERVKKKGIMATQFHVEVDDSQDHPHRHLRHVVEIIDQGDLAEPVKRAAKGTFERLAEAEAAVHGSTIEKVHFHEVGAIDSIVDIVAAQFCLHNLGIDTVYCSPLNVGGGTVKAAHGVMPVPAPATALLLQNIPTYGAAEHGELVTPTGAALVAHTAQDFGGAPRMRVSSIGYGCGTKDLPDRANVLRVLAGEPSGRTAGAHSAGAARRGDAGPADGPALETVGVLEATVDDISGELLPPLVEALLADGALDVSVASVLAKKGRPAHAVTVLCSPNEIPRLARTLFAHSPTLGVRTRCQERLVLGRRWEQVDTPWGGVGVKLGVMDGAVVNAAPEFEACKSAAAEAGVPVRRVYEQAAAAAWRQWTGGREQHGG